MTTPTQVHGTGTRCVLWQRHELLRFSDAATCFQCQHFDQPLDEDGECAWSLNFDDTGTCKLGSHNGELP